MIAKGPGRLTAGPVSVRGVAPVRVAEVAATAPSYSRQDIGPVLRSLYPELLRRLSIAGTHPTGNLVIVHYADPPEPSDAVIVHAAVPVAGLARPGRGFAVVDLPAIRRAATLTHRGPAEQLTRSLWLLAGWIEDNGYRGIGYHRELYLGSPDDRAGGGVTELQVSVSMDAGRCAGGIAADGLCSAFERKPDGVGTRAWCYRAQSVNWL